MMRFTPRSLRSSSCAFNDSGSGARELTQGFVTCWADVLAQPIVNASQAPVNVADGAPVGGVVIRCPAVERAPVEGLKRRIRELQRF
jgi:hypothetical protein